MCNLVLRAVLIFQAVTRLSPHPIHFFMERVNNKKLYKHTSTSNFWCRGKINIPIGVKSLWDLFVLFGNAQSLLIFIDLVIPPYTDREARS